MQENTAGVAPQMQQNTTAPANGTNPQMSQAPSAPNESLKQGNSSNKIKILGILVVVVILIAVCLVFFKNSGSTTLANSTTTSGVSPTTSASSNGGMQDLSNGGGGGPGQYYISKSEAAGLLGAGGTYYAFYNPNPGQEYGVFINNVTGNWGVIYSVHSSAVATNSLALVELIYQSPKAQYLYAAELNPPAASNETVEVVNATSNGLTYSLIREAAGSISLSVLVGYKKGVFVLISSPQELNQTKLASIVTGDIP
jgi:hypothetical protein